MATKRRSVRERKLPQNYFKDSSSEEEGEDDNVKAAKQKLKQMINEDSDAESDFEKEIEKMESSDESVESGDDADNITGAVKKKDKNSFCLSESDSSDDEAQHEKMKSKQNINIFLRQESFNLEEDGLEEGSQKLLALAGNLNRINDVWKESSSTSTKKKEVPKKGKEKKRKSAEVFETVKKPKREEEIPSLDSISKLLAQGEGVEEHANFTSDEEMKEPILPKNGVEITVPVPEHMRKRKKKEFDMAAYIKRELARGERELAAVCHKVGVVGLLAHLLHLHLTTSSPSLQCLALSLVPPSHAHSEDSLTLTRLGHLVSWLRDTVPVNKHDSQEASIKSVTTRLEHALASLLVMSDMELVVVFVLVCRALGLNTRILMSLNLPGKSDSQKPAAAKTSKAAGGSKSRKRSKSSDSESDQDEDEDDKTSKSKSKRKVEKKEESKIDSVRSGSRDNDSKGTLSSKLAAAVNKRKSKSLAPTLTEDSIIENIRKTPSKSGESSKSSSSKESKSKSKSDKNSEKGSKVPSSKNGKTSKTHSKETDRHPSPSSNTNRSKDKSSGSKQSKSKNSKESEKAQDIEKSRNSYSQYYWVEIYIVKEKRWIPVDVLTGKINNAAEIESRLPKPVLYVFAVNMKGRVKDLTRRYASNYLTQSRKLRVEEKWLEETLCPWLDRDNKKEDTELVRKSEEAPLPTNVGAFKGHPLYALQRHLLKFEAIYPVDAPTLGFIKGEPVFARECVHTLLGRTAWLKEGKVVRIGEEPYKVVKARPKWDRMSGCKKADEPLELFGHWQTELYIAPVAVDGKVPRNEYGNVELFKPWMMPKGCVQIPINGMQSVIRKSGIDAAPAMVGWDFSSGGSHPVFDGYIVCQENADALMDAWNQEQELKLQREKDKREKRVLDNWKRLVKGLMFREKMRLKYMKE